MIGKCKLGSCVESDVAAVVLLVEVFFELMIVQFLFLVPVPNAGYRIVAIGDIVVMHEVILLIKNLNEK